MTVRNKGTGADTVLNFKRGGGALSLLYNVNQYSTSVNMSSFSYTTTKACDYVYVFAFRRYGKLCSKTPTFTLSSTSGTQTELDSYSGNSGNTSLGHAYVMKHIRISNVSYGTTITGTFSNFDATKGTEWLINILG